MVFVRRFLEEAPNLLLNLISLPVSATGVILPDFLRGIRSCITVLLIYERLFGGILVGFSSLVFPVLPGLQSSLED